VGLGVPENPAPLAELGYESSPVSFRVQHPDVGLIHVSEAVKSAAVHMSAAWAAEYPVKS